MKKPTRLEKHKAEQEAKGLVRFETRLPKEEVPRFRKLAAAARKKFLK